MIAMTSLSAPPHTMPSDTVRSGVSSFVVEAGASYTPHDPIVITSDSDFASQGWPGNGTETEPYVIEWLNITSPEKCIHIALTSVYFEVRNCFISSSSQSLDVGIELDAVANGAIEHCVVERHRVGIGLYSSNNCTLVHNTASDNTYPAFLLEESDNNTLAENTASGNLGIGFSLSWSNNNRIANNTAVNNTGNGFDLFYSDENIIVNNTAADSLDGGFYVETSCGNTLAGNTAKGNSYEGFIFWEADNNSFIGNTAIDNWQGIILYSSSGNKVMANTLIGNGMDIFGYDVSEWFHNVTGNTINGMPLGYFANLTGGIIDGSKYAQLLLVNCSGVTIRDGIFANASAGVELAYSANCTLMNNIAFNNSLWGFRLWASNNSHLVDNVATGNSLIGFYLVRSSQTALTGNTATGNLYRGYDLSRSSWNTLSSNTAAFNSVDGFGLFLSDNNTLSGNTATNNSEDGFYLGRSDGNILTNNTATSNMQYGISLSLSFWNTVYLNKIGHNGKSNAYDYGGLNSWDDGVSQGNCWSDYNGTGVYIIPGSSESVDHYSSCCPESNSTAEDRSASPFSEQMIIVAVGSATTVISLTIVASLRKRAKFS